MSETTEMSRKSTLCEERLPRTSQFLDETALRDHAGPSAKECHRLPAQAAQVCADHTSCIKFHAAWAAGW